MSQCFCQKCLWQPEEQQDTDAQLEAATAKELESQVKRLEAERDELKQELADADLLHTGMCSEREALEADRDKYKRKSEHLWRAMSVLDVKTEDIERAILLTIEEERP
jgi:septal ring factor EnvC (AmiA/AmiB activator)